MNRCPHQSLLHLDNFAHGTPREEIARLRNNHRIVWQSDEYANGGHWLVLHRDDIDQVLRDPARFSSGFGPLLEDFPAELLPAQRLAMTFMDPPAHRNKRALVDHVFRPNVLDARKAMMQKKVTAIIDNIIDKGHCEFVGEVALHLPVHVIFTLLGVPEADYEYLIGLINTMTLANDPDYGGKREDGFIAIGEFMTWARKLAAAHRAEPRDNLTMDLLNAEIDGAKLTDDEFAVIFQGIIIGGTETTRNTLSWLFYELIRHPAQLALLQSDLNLIPAAIEEILRFRNTVVYLRRTATGDFQFAGEAIKQGDKLICVLAAVNRDEQYFDQPDTFDIARDPINNRRAMRTFGFGVHTCLGQHQARLNLEMMTREILTRMQNFTLLEEPTHFRSNFMDGFKRMPMAFERR
jgi:cholest-4-en-3-one 26-monooxygenase